MNTRTITHSTHTDKLETLIQAWAEEHNILKPGEVIEVNINIISPPKVIVSLTGYHGPSNKEDIWLKDLGISVRLLNLLKKHTCSKVGHVCTRTKEELVKLGLSPKNLSELKQVLTDLEYEIDW